MKNDAEWLSPADYTRRLLGPRRIAEACGLFWSVPYKWRKTIPCEHHQALMQYAGRLGAPLTPGHLVYGGPAPDDRYVVRLPRGPRRRKSQIREEARHEADRA